MSPGYCIGIRAAQALGYGAPWAALHAHPSLYLPLFVGYASSLLMHIPFFLPGARPGARRRHHQQTQGGPAW